VIFDNVFDVKLLLLVLNRYCNPEVNLNVESHLRFSKKTFTKTQWAPFFKVHFFLYPMRDGNSKKLSMTRACIPSVFEKSFLRIRIFKKARNNILLVVSKIMSRSY